MDDQVNNQENKAEDESSIKSSEAYVEFFKFIFDKTLAYLRLFINFFSTPVSAWESVRSKDVEFKELQKEIILPIAVVASVMALFFNVIQGELSYGLYSSIMAFFAPFITVHIFYLVLSKANGFDIFKYQSTPQGNIKLAVYSLIVPLFPFAQAIYAIFGDSTSFLASAINVLVSLGLGIYGIYILIKGLDTLAQCENKAALISVMLLGVVIASATLQILVGGVFL